jgi:hypothetical protein
MHPQLTYLLARDRIHERVAQAERDHLGAVVSDAESAERRGRSWIVSLWASNRSQTSRRAAAEVADQR